MRVRLLLHNHFGVFLAIYPAPHGLNNIGARWLRGDGGNGRAASSATALGYTASEDGEHGQRGQTGTVLQPTQQIAM
jgi:hypothetical protein